MSTIKLISDSSCDFTIDDVKKYNIDIIPFSVSFDDTTYLKENIDITCDEFYDKLDDPSVFAKTSLPAVNLYLEAFEKAYKEKQEILCFTLSSKFSGSYQSAENAKRIMEEDYPDCKIKIVDTLQASIAQAGLIKFAYKLINDGKSIDEVYDIVLRNRENAKVMLTVSTLKYLQKGGRIGKVQAVAGEFLQLSPIINITDGELVSCAKVRGIKKAYNFISSNLLELANEKGLDPKTCEVVTFSCKQDISSLTSKLKEDGFENIEHMNIGITIAAHTGNTITGACLYSFSE